jgi:hypothetical protein
MYKYTFALEVTARTVFIVWLRACFFAYDFQQLGQQVAANNFCVVCGAF